MEPLEVQYYLHLVPKLLVGWFVFLFFFFLIMCMGVGLCVGVCMWVQVLAEARRVLSPLELELQAVVGGPT